MSQPAKKKSRQIGIEEARKSNQVALIKVVQESLRAEKNAERKKNIQACLTELEVKKTSLTGDQCIVAVKGKATKLENRDFTKRFDALDAESRKLLYCVRGTNEQMMAGTARPIKPTGPTREQMLQVASYTQLEPRLSGDGLTTMHQIFATVRIPARYRAAGLQGESLRRAEGGKHFVVAFDTGSELQSIERDIWEYIAGVNGRNYIGPEVPGAVSGVTGAESRTYVKVEVGYFRDTERRIQIGRWQEIDAIYSSRSYEHNLSGREIFNDFAFIVPKGNGTLIMGTNKAAVVWEYLTMSSKEGRDIALIQEWAAGQIAAGASGTQGRGA